MRLSKRDGKNFHLSYFRFTILGYNNHSAQAYTSKTKLNEDAVFRGILVVFTDLIYFTVF